MSMTLSHAHEFYQDMSIDHPFHAYFNIYYMLFSGVFGFEKMPTFYSNASYILLTFMFIGLFYYAMFISTITEEINEKHRINNKYNKMFTILENEQDREQVELSPVIYNQIVKQLEENYNKIIDNNIEQLRNAIDPNLFKQLQRQL